MLISWNLLLDFFFKMSLNATIQRFPRFWQKLRRNCLPASKVVCCSTQDKRDGHFWVFLRIQPKQCLGRGDLGKVYLFHTLCPLFPSIFLKREQCILWNWLSNTSWSSLQLSCQRIRSQAPCSESQTRSHFNAEQHFPRARANVFILPAGSALRSKVLL